MTISKLWSDPEIEPAAERICENCRFWAAPVIPDDTGDCQRLHTGLTDGDAFQDEDWAQTEATDTCSRWKLHHGYEVDASFLESSSFKLVQVIKGSSNG